MSSGVVFPHIFFGKCRVIHHIKSFSVMIRATFKNFQKAVPEFEILKKKNLSKLNEDSEAICTVIVLFRIVLLPKFAHFLFVTVFHCSDITPEGGVKP